MKVIIPIWSVDWLTQMQYQQAVERHEAIAANYWKDVRSSQLQGSMFTSNLMLTMYKSSISIFVGQSRSSAIQVLLHIGYKKYSGAHAHMVARKLMFQDFCHQASQRRVPTAIWQKGMASGKSWCTRCPSSIDYFCNHPSWYLSILSQASGTRNTTKMGNFYKCRKDGHWAKSVQNLPLLLVSPNHLDPIRIAPKKLDPGAPFCNFKKMKDNMTFNWYEKCRCWWNVTRTLPLMLVVSIALLLLLHLNTIRANLSMLMPHPSIWMFDSLSHWTATPFLACSWWFLSEDLTPGYFLPCPLLFLPLFLICFTWLSIKHLPFLGSPFWHGSSTVFTKLCSVS